MIYAAFTTEGLDESLVMMASGFLVVMSVLILLMVSITVIGWLFSAVDRKNKKKVIADGETSLTPTADAASGPSGLSASTLALIAAAVHTTVKGPYRIVGIEHRHSSHEEENLQVSSWSVEGRRAIFSSHRVR